MTRIDTAYTVQGNSYTVRGRCEAYRLARAAEHNGSLRASVTLADSGDYIVTVSGLTIFAMLRIARQTLGAAGVAA